MIRGITIAAAVALSLTPAQGSDVVRLQTTDGSNLPVFFDGAAADRAATLAREGINVPPDLQMTLVKCAVKSGTRALIEGHSVNERVWAYPVTIVDGYAAGCRGVVPGVFMSSPDGKMPP